MPAPTANSLLDRVDAADRPIGVVKRADVFHLGPDSGFRVVHILVVNRAGHLLLQQVGSKRERSPMRWGSSVAGYVFAGESYADAAERRGREELGLESKLRKLGSLRMSDNDTTKFIELFQVNAETAENREPDLIQEIRFWTMSDIERTLSAEPQQFTETFPVVYRLFLASIAR
jgi:isopentenyl-diphosphate delta-isomerase